MNENTSAQHDPWIDRMSVAVLGLVVLASVIGATILAMESKSTPEALLALGSAAVGGLAGWLVPSPLKR